MDRPTFPPLRVMREGFEAECGYCRRRDHWPAPCDPPPILHAAGDLEGLWFAVLGLIVGGLLGFVAGWATAADFIHG